MPTSLNKEKKNEEEGEGECPDVGRKSFKCAHMCPIHQHAHNDRIFFLSFI